jgi:hypothetical protein
MQTLVVSAARIVPPLSWVLIKQCRQQSAGTSNQLQHSANSTEARHHRQVPIAMMGKLLSSLMGYSEGLARGFD